MKMNSKGEAGDWPDLIGFFLVLIILGAGIVISYSVFFGNSYDIKEGEARLIHDQLKECLLEEKDKIFLDDFNLLECGFSENIRGGNILIYLERESDGKVKFEGVRDFVNQCELIDESGKFAKCWKSEISIGENVYTIIGASNQESRDVAV